MSLADEFDQLWDRLVPESGQANSVQGELVRAVGRLAHDYFANGSSNWSEDYESLSEFVLHQLADPKTFDADSIKTIRNDVRSIQSYGRRERKDYTDLDVAFDRLQSFAVIWCGKHADLKPLPPGEAAKLKRETKLKSRTDVVTCYEPLPDHLEQLHGLVKLTLIHFESQLVKLKPNDFLPRYNSVLIELSQLSNLSVNFLFISVHRKGSKIGEDNVFTEALHVPELATGRKCRYEVFCFDGFNLPFETIEVNLITPAEYAKRPLGENYQGRAIELTNFVGFVDG